MQTNKVLLRFFSGLRIDYIAVCVEVFVSKSSNNKIIQ